MEFHDLKHIFICIPFGFFNWTFYSLLVVDPDSMTLVFNWVHTIVPWYIYILATIILTEIIFFKFKVYHEFKDKRMKKTPFGVIAFSKLLSSLVAIVFIFCFIPLFSALGYCIYYAVINWIESLKVIGIISLSTIVGTVYVYINKIIVNKIKK